MKGVGRQCICEEGPHSSGHETFVIGLLTWDASASESVIGPVFMNFHWVYLNI